MPLAQLAGLALVRKMTNGLARTAAAMREAMSRDGYRPEKHYMRGPGPKAMARGLHSDTRQAS